MDVKNLLKALESLSVQGRSKFILLPTVNGHLPQGGLESLSKALPGLTHFCPLAESFHPYEPLASWIREGLGTGDPEALDRHLDAAKAQGPVRALLRSWLLEKFPRRDECLIPDEAEFENERLKRVLAEIFSGIFQGQSRIFVLERFQDLGRSLHELFYRDLFSRETGAPVFLLVFPLGHEAETSGADRDFWRSFLEKYQTSAQEGLVALGAKPGRQNLRRYSLRHPEGVLAELETLVTLGAHPEAGILLNRLETLIHAEKDFLTLDQTLRFLILAGRQELGRGNPEASRIYGEKALALLREKPGKDRLIQVCLHLGWCAWAQKDPLRLGRWLGLIAGSLGEADPQRLEFLFLKLFLDYLDRRLDYGDWKALYRGFLALGQEGDKNNTMAYWLVNPYRMDTEESWQEAVYYQDWGMEICRTLGNSYRMADACLAQAGFWIRRGDWDRAMEDFNQAENLRREFPSNGGMVSVLNNRGWFLMDIGSHAEAQENFFKALGILRETPDLTETGLTLFNLGMNYLRCGQWSDGEQCFLALLRLLDILDTENLVFHSRKEVLIGLGICLYKTGQTTRAYEIWLQIQGAGGLPESSLLLYWGFEAWIRAYESHPEKALGVLLQGKNLCLEGKKYLLFDAPYFFLEMGDFFRSQTMVAESVAAYQNGLSATMSFPNFRLRDLLDRRLHPGRNEEPVQTLPALARDLDWIADAGLHSRQLTLLTREKASLEAVAQGVEIILKERDEAEALGELIRLISRNTGFGALMIKEDEGAGWTTLYSSDLETGGPLEVSARGLEVLRSLGAQVFVPQVATHPELAPLNLGWPRVLSLQADFRQEYRLHFVGIPAQSDFMDQHLVQALVPVLGMLAQCRGQSRWTGRIQRLYDSLARVSLQDPLTGLPGRQAFLTQVEQERQRLQRYRPDDPGWSVLLIDLDGFAGINRRLGYAAGDRLLCRFSDFLKTQVRGSDHVFRTGGDEFGILLAETTGEGPSVMAERILKAWDQTSPGEEGKIGFTLGGGTWKISGLRMVEAAEEALAEGKRRGKGRIRID